MQSEVGYLGITGRDKQRVVPIGRPGRGGDAGVSACVRPVLEAAIVSLVFVTAEATPLTRQGKTVAARAHSWDYACRRPTCPAFVCHTSVCRGADAIGAKRCSGSRHRDDVKFIPTSTQQLKSPHCVFPRNRSARKDVLAQERGVVRALGSLECMRKLARKSCKNNA